MWRSVRSGISHVEVLVIIIIATALCGVGYSHWSSKRAYREKACILSCLGNMRQIGQAFEMYWYQKGDGRKMPTQSDLVDGIKLPGKTPGLKLANALFQGKSPTINSTGNFICPTALDASANRFHSSSTVPFDIGEASYLFRSERYAALGVPGLGSSPYISDRVTNHWRGIGVYMLDRSVQFFEFNLFPYAINDIDNRDSTISDAAGNVLLTP